MKTRQPEITNLDADFFNCWKEFVETGAVSDEAQVREIILDSWKRSLAYGVDPLSKNRVFKDCNELIAANRQLIDVSLPYMEQINNFVGGSGFVVVLIDREGYILKTLGDFDVVNQANRNNLSPGECRSEKISGTNAIGVSLKTGKPVQICGPEHYKRDFHDWTCSAAPIRDPDGVIIGALNLSGHYSLLHKHTLGMVVSAVKAIEREINLIETNKDILNANKYLEAVIDSVTDGLLSIATDGRIMKMNSRAKAYLGHEVKALEDLFEPGSKLYEMLKNEKGFSDMECYFRNSDSYCLVSAKAIGGADGENIGFLIMIKGKKKLHSLVNRIVGSTATFTFEDIIGRSSVIRECIELAKMAAQTGCKVLLEGESGTGKELFAQGIHNYSARRDAPFIAVNCSAIPRELVESELFGYEEGAFSGAKKKGKPGRFELAEGGTIFLDEASTISLDMQAKLLRVLQENSIMRLGGVKQIPLDVRLIVASNRDLAELVEEGTFRDDLYYRLSVFTLRIPPLRERKEDIPLLVEHICRKNVGLSDSGTVRVSPAVSGILEAYHWPGNIRELENVIERAIILSRGNLDSPDYLSEMIQKTAKKRSCPVEELESVKINTIRNALQETNGNVSRAAKILGVSRNTIYNSIKKMGGELPVNTKRSFGF